MFDGAVIGQTNMSPPTTVVTILTIAIDGLAVEWNNFPSLMTNVAIIVIMIMIIVIALDTVGSIITIIA